MRVILIIDDDPDDLQLFCKAIREIDKQYHCLTAYNGEDGLKLLKTSAIKPEYIFLDLNMPRINGKQCLEKIKSDPSLAEIAVIIYTTSKIKKDVDETMQFGASGFLTKPTSFDELVKALTIILEENFPRKKFTDHLHDHYTC